MDELGREREREKERERRRERSRNTSRIRRVKLGPIIDNGFQWIELRAAE